MLNGKFRCIKGCGYYMNEGQIYEFINGRVKWGGVLLSPAFTSVFDYNRICGSKIEPYVEKQRPLKNSQIWKLSEDGKIHTGDKFKMGDIIIEYHHGSFLKEDNEDYPFHASDTWEPMKKTMKKEDAELILDVIII